MSENRHSPMRTLVIERDKWCTGSHRNGKGEMCAVGFYLRDLGILDENAQYCDVESLKASEGKWLFDEDAHDYSDVTWWGITRANDADCSKNTISLENQEKIAKIFADHGVNVLFVGFDA
jgi:hypothetical protein